MPYFHIIAPQIPADRKDEFLAAWPTMSADIKAQPGVAGVSAGAVVAEDGAAVTDFKFVQCIAFKTAEDVETFKKSSWAQERKARYESKAGSEIVAGEFEVADFPVDATPKAFVQFTTIVFGESGDRPEVSKAWVDLTTALGKDTWGGKSIGDGPTVGLGMIGWDSVEEAGVAFKEPQAASAFAAYKALGQTRNLIVQMQL
ncbi:hypothetical protein BGZ61DRAFT_371206 [Ilyonectria robusta]|uniref:uncharacterized protein n=1 Tax=Ilyonectria robusta TaxID=1079257 RepID=UPI001E8E8B90|nr:uncharacterized protein BGZ61DRAFT_371206 [Ilyonectria robusta]KAH8658526.1 hypothetical protein BGZ61DRAFT_371206 [Ilyonectria robusta]